MRAGRKTENLREGQLETTHANAYRVGHYHGKLAKGSVESTHKVPTSHYHTKHCHAAVFEAKRLIGYGGSFQHCA